MMTGLTARVDTRTDAEVVVQAPDSTELGRLPLPGYDPRRWHDPVEGRWDTDGYDRADAALRDAGYERVGPWMQGLAEGPALGTTLMLSTGVWAAAVLGPATSQGEARRWLEDADRRLRTADRRPGHHPEVLQADGALHGARRAYARAVGQPADAGEDDGTGQTTQGWLRRIERMRKGGDRL